MSMMPYFVPTRFVWKFGGKQVHLCGSFTRWVETVPMIPVDQSPGMFAVLVHLPPGYHQYKFIVDGEWRHDETQTFMPDPLGNVNNWLYVRAPDAAGAVPIGMHMASPARAGQSQTPDPTDAHSIRQQQHADPHNNQQPSPSQPHHSPAGQPSPLSTPPQIAAHPMQTGNGYSERPGIQHVDQQGHQNGAAAAAQQASPLGNMGEGLAEGDLHLQDSEAVLPPIALQEDEPACTRKKVLDFLNSHTAYELIPESGKVVVIDIDYSVRRAFHALHEQSISSAPLWDSHEQSIVGMISASDFIATLKKLRDAAGSGGALTDSEMDFLTIRGMRDAAAVEGAHAKTLVFCRETDTFSSAVRTLVQKRCSMAPILSCSPVNGEDVPSVLHIATLSGVLACLMRHFRASLASLPLLSQPLASMPIGTWSPDSPIGRQGHAQTAEGRPVSIAITPIHTIHPSTPLTTALSMLLEAGISALPVVDSDGVLLDVYARGDITLLARGNSYSRLQYDDMTVEQALSLAGIVSSSGSQSGDQVGEPAGMRTASKRTRLYFCTRHDQLRLVLERLSMPAVRRVIVVHPETWRVEGIISLSDVARFMFM